MGICFEKQMMLECYGKMLIKCWGRGRRSQVDIPLNINGVVVNDNLSVANENDYLKAVVENLNREIPGSAVDLLSFVTTKYFTYSGPPVFC